MYIVIEMQTNGSSTATIANAYESFNVANQQYHTILSAASVSTVNTHTAVMLNDRGEYIKSEYIQHEAE